MNNLRLLKICYIYLIGHAEYYFEKEVDLTAKYFEEGVLKHGNMNVFEGINYLPNELRYLTWHGYPSKSLPSNFHPWNLVEIDMSCSRLEQLWKNQINLESLEFLNLSHSQNLTETPDFSGFPRLKILILQGCTRLVKVHPSNLVLNMLVFLNLKDCKSLCSLWKGIELKSLQTLILSGCSKLEKFPDILRTMERLSKVYLDGTGIKELPSSIEHLTGLVSLNLENCKNLTSLPSNIGMLKSLERLTLSGCSKLESIPQIPKDMEHLSIYLNGTGIKELPSSIEHLTGLVSLNLENCKNLTSLPSNICMLKSLELLTLSGCSKLESFPEISEDMEHLAKLLLDGTAIKELPSSITHLKRLVMLNLGNCKNLASLPSGICELKSLETLTLSGCSKLEKLPENFGNLQNLVGLRLDGTAITQPPSSVVLLKNLQTLSFRGCRGSSSHSWKSIFSPLSLLGRVPGSSGLMLPCLSGLRSLRSLDLSDCNLSGGGIFSAIVGLSSLKDLDLSKNNFDSLPATFNQFNSLKFLVLENCTRLRALPLLPTSTRVINASGCISLEKLSYPPENLKLSSRYILFGNCKMLAGHKGITFFQRHFQAISGADSHFNFLVPGSEIPKWMKEQSMGSSICFKMSPLEYSKFKGLVICAVFSHNLFVCTLYKVIDGDSSRRPLFPYMMCPGRGFPGRGFSESDHVWLRYQPRQSDWDCFQISSDGWHHFEASFVGEGRLASPLQMKKCGVHIIYEEDDEPTMIASNSSVHNLTLEEVEEEEEEDLVITKHKRRLAKEEASGSGCSKGLAQILTLTHG